MTRWSIFALVLLICTTLSKLGGALESQRHYFEGKTINLIVPYSPAGGYDIYARMIAPYLKKYMQTSVIVQNKPGAGGITALNGMTLSPPDGLQLALINGNGAAIAQILDQPGVRYDLSKFDYLGGAGIVPDVWLFAPQLQVNSFTEALKLNHPIRWGATGATDILAVGAAITCATFKIECRIIMGYSGAADVAIALARNEIDAMIVSESAAVNYVSSGSARIIATMSKQRSRYFRDSPTIYETSNINDDGRWWLDFRSNLEVLNKVFIGPLGMPEARLDYLRSVMKQTLDDPDLIAEGEKTSRIVDYQTPESIKQAVLALTSRFTDEDKGRIRTVILDTYSRH